MMIKKRIIVVKTLLDIRFKNRENMNGARKRSLNFSKRCALPSKIASKVNQKKIASIADLQAAEKELAGKKAALLHFRTGERQDVVTLDLVPTPATKKTAKNAKDKEE